MRNMGSKNARRSGKDMRQACFFETSNMVQDGDGRQPSIDSLCEVYFNGAHSKGVLT